MKMLSTMSRTSLLLMIVTTVTVLDQVESMSWAIQLPTIPSVRSFFWPNQIPSDNAEEIARQHAAQTQNSIAQTQNNIAQTQSTVGDQVRRMQDNIRDNISNQVSDINRTFDYNGSPGTKRTVAVSNDGITEEVITNYESPDGNHRGFTKTSVSTFGNNWK